MKPLLAALLLVTSLSATASTDKFKQVHVADLDQWITSKNQAVYVLDANNDTTRTKEGVIPGAKILTSYDKYAMSELPSNKNAKLVFYCANTQCSASHDAANRAISAGYKDVSVMVDGIEGWKKAGKIAKPYGKT
jgi:rhodanese-related sulfurtransferase